MRIKLLIISALYLLLTASCSSHKTVLPYFTDIASNQHGELAQLDYLPTVQPDDELLISVSSVNMVAVQPYMMPMGNTAAREDILRPSSPQYLPYIVDSKGDIDMPVLGRIHVGGKNVEQIAQEITNLIKRDVEDPVVRVELLNFKVIVAGEVVRPNSIPVKNNRITILEAISQAGDLTPYGERSNVLVIREENGKRTYARVDLNSSDLLNSPYYYLKQNDYIYVEPNNIRQANSKYNQDNAFKLSVISTVVSASSVIASLIIALAVK